MRCIKCELENRAGRKFCAACGSVLSIPYQGCGFANEPTERYCGGCGHAAGDGGTIGVTIRPERTADPDGDRRPVTVMFCDLVSYTQLLRCWILKVRCMPCLSASLHSLMQPSTALAGRSTSTSATRRWRCSERRLQGAMMPSALYAPLWKYKLPFPSSRPGRIRLWLFTSASRRVKSWRVRWKPTPPRLYRHW